MSGWADAVNVWAVGAGHSQGCTAQRAQHDADIVARRTASLVWLNNLAPAH